LKKRGPYKKHIKGGARSYMIDGQLITRIDVGSIWRDNMTSKSFYKTPENEVVTSGPWQPIRGERILTLSDLVNLARKFPKPKKGGWQSGRKTKKDL